MKGIHLLRGNPKGIHHNGPNHPSMATYMFYFGYWTAFFTLIQFIHELAEEPLIHVRMYKLPLYA